MSFCKQKPQGEHKEIGANAQMFTLRIWVTNQKGTNLEWRGRIQHIQGGEVQYCQNWDAFITYVEEILRNPADI